MSAFALKLTVGCVTSLEIAGAWESGTPTAPSPDCALKEVDVEAVLHRASLRRHAAQVMSHSVSSPFTITSTTSPTFLPISPLPSGEPGVTT